jgi:hypothetical protein
MPFQLSPGVAVVEKDFSSIVPAVSTSVGASAGAFAWGPVMTPFTVSSENELVRYFGKPNDSNASSFFTAANFLSYTNNLLLVRASATSLKNAVSLPSGGVDTISVGTAGSGYISTAAAPAVTIAAPDDAGGTVATATATLSGGAITAIAVSDGGTGYDSGADVTIVAASGDLGSGATATATVVDGVITAIVVSYAGTGYKAIPTVNIAAISGDSGAGATATATVGASTITGITITETGSGYSAAPTVTIAAAPSGGTDALATATISTQGAVINNGEDYLQTYANGAGSFGQWAAKYPGAMGNSLKVSFSDDLVKTISGSSTTWAYAAEFDAAPGTSTYAASVGGARDEMHVIVIDEDGAFTGVAGTILEKFSFVSKASDGKKSDGTNNYYKDVINSRSEYIWWMDHAADALSESGAAWGLPAAGNTFKTMNAFNTASLTGGVDDYVLTDANKMNAFALFANAELYDISLVMAGQASTTVAEYVINSVAESRLDCVAFVSPEANGSPIVGNSSTHIESINSYRNSLPSTSYGVIDSGYKYQYDRYNDKYRYIPLNADIAGLCARTDYTNDAWFSPGGLNRGQIKNVVRLAVNPNKTQRDALYKNGVNPVVSFPGEGTVLFGDKTLLAKPSAFDRINVRRLFIVMEKAIATAAKFQLFEFNDGFTRAQFKNLVEPFLRDVQGRRGITDFVVKCDTSNNTGEVIDRNEFVADIFVKPNRSINFITLNFVAARSGINFAEIGA